MPDKEEREKSTRKQQQWKTVNEQPNDLNEE